MDDLQYQNLKTLGGNKMTVLNLVINGWPSILSLEVLLRGEIIWSFKPCYKWMTFNT